MSVRSDLQAALDTALAPDKVYSHWLRKIKLDGENPNEYVVHTIDGDIKLTRVDGATLLMDANPVIRYYHAFSLNAGQVDTRRQQIYAALEAAGFNVDTGPFDAGDIDDVGMNTTVFECSYTRVV